MEQDLLDIDPAVKPDIVADAKEMQSLKGRSYDAVYCSHNLEHYYKHEVPLVLRGFLHVLKPKGFAYIAVPDMMALFKAVAEQDIDDVWYMAGPNPIHFHDVIYGWGAQVSQGNLYYCHKTGFSEKSLVQVLRRTGFAKILTARDGYNLFAFAFKNRPSSAQLRRLGL